MIDTGWKCPFVSFYIKKTWIRHVKFKVKTKKKSGTLIVRKIVQKSVSAKVSVKT